MTSLRVRLVESPKIAQEGQGPGKDHRMLRFPSSVEYVMHGSSDAKKKGKFVCFMRLDLGSSPFPWGRRYSSVKVTGVLVVPFRGLDFWIGTA